MTDRPLLGKSRREIEEILSAALSANQYSMFDAIRREMIERLDGKRPRNWHRKFLNLSVKAVKDYSQSNDPAEEYCQLRDKLRNIINDLSVLDTVAIARKFALWRRDMDAWNRRYPTAAFRWPSTDAVGEGSATLPEFAAEISPLKLLGYTVGNRGLSATLRLAILSEAFTGILPPVQDEKYMRKWGDRNTPVRLKQIANHIAASTRNAKRNNPSKLRSAITDWEDDLDFLKNTFYISHFSFSWPET